MYLGSQARIALRWSPLLVLGVLLTAVPTYLLVSGSPPVYEATARTIVTAGLDPSLDDLQVAEARVHDQALRASTGRFLMDLRNDLGFSEDVAALRGQITIRPELDRAVLEISVRNSDPEQAAVLANAIADQIIEESRSSEEPVLAVDAYLRSVQDDIARLERRVAALRSRETLTADEQAELTGLLGDVGSLWSAYAAVVPLSTVGSSEHTEYLDAAVATDDAVEPRPLYFAVLAGTLGLLVALAAAFIVEYRNDRSSDPSQLEDASGVPFIGRVQEAKQDARLGGAHRLVMIARPASSAADSFRRLRETIAILTHARPAVKALTITGVGVSADKTATAANLALAYSQAGRRVLLVDADLRRPSVHKLFGLSNETGLSTLMSHDPSTVQYSLVSPQPRLWVLPGGPPVADPAVIIESPGMRIFLNRYIADVDLVIFDSPALPDVTDAALISSLTQGTILVVPGSGINLRDIRAASDMLSLAGASVLGVVIHETVRSLGRSRGPSVRTTAHEGGSTLREQSQAG